MDFLYKAILAFFITASCNSYLFSQNGAADTTKTEDSEYVLFFPSHSLDKIEMSLRARYNLINLSTHPRINLTDEQHKAYSRLFSLPNPVIIDSISITLKSGITWNLLEGPPPQPKHFYFKALTKKGRKDKAVLDRLKYLQFCNAWMEKDELPRERVEKINSYYAIISEGTKRFEMSHEFKFVEDRGTEVTTKEIKFYTE